MTQPINKSGKSHGVRTPFRPMQKWYVGEPVSASKLNEMADGINRIAFGVRPPEQTRVFTGGGGGSGANPTEATIRGAIRFFSE